MDGLELEFCVRSKECREARCPVSSDFGRSSQEPRVFHGMAWQAQALEGSSPLLKKRMSEAKVALELRKAVKQNDLSGIEGAIEAAGRVKVDSVEIQAARRYVCVCPLSVAHGSKSSALPPTPPVETKR
jgi:hypothetical protein